MDELLEQLELRIKSLLDRHEKLQQSQSSLIHEKRLLQDKNEVAISQVEKMISRLKSLEKS